jgi:hypothetical protein
MARPAGLEPATPGLEGRCSIRLSYGRNRTGLNCTTRSHWLLLASRSVYPRPACGLFVPYFGDALTVIAEPSSFACHSAHRRPACGLFVPPSVALLICVCNYTQNWSGQRDSNPRPSAPKADALPGCAMPRHLSYLPPLAVFTPAGGAVYSFDPAPAAG